MACYRRAFVHAPPKKRDMVAAGLANTLHLADRFTDATTLMQMALQVGGWLEGGGNGIDGPWLTPGCRRLLRDIP